MINLSVTIFYAVVFHSSVSSVISGVFIEPFALPEDHGDPKATLLPVLEPLTEPVWPRRRDMIIKTPTIIAATTTRTAIVIPAMAPALSEWLLVLLEEDESEGENTLCNLANWIEPSPTYTCIYIYFYKIDVHSCIYRYG